MQGMGGSGLIMGSFCSGGPRYAREVPLPSGLRPSSAQENYVSAIELLARGLPHDEQLVRRERDVTLEPVEQRQERLAAARGPQVGGQPAQRRRRRADPREPDAERIGALADGRKGRFAHVEISPWSMA